MRPGVVWFGESLDPAIVAAAARATEQCDLFITIGTSAVVYPAAGFIHEARANGATVAEINPDATEASNAVDISIRGKAEEVLPRAVTPHARGSAQERLAPGAEPHRPRR